MGPIFSSIKVNPGRYFLIMILCVVLPGCEQFSEEWHLPTEVSLDSLALVADARYGRGGLLLSDFESFDELKTVIRIEYADCLGGPDHFMLRRPYVRLTHTSDNRQVTSVLKSGVSEMDFVRAWDGDLWDRIWLALRSPYTVINKKDLGRVYALARRRDQAFGEGDVAFYDLAEHMVFHFSATDTIGMTERDLGEKGYLNTFNHIIAQAFMTSLFSERLADFVADTHERRHTPQLISGEFSDEQLADLENGPTDNYVDIINNEWGQELGKALKVKYQIDRKIVWTPELLANYLNDIQKYCSWAFQVGFEPFRSRDDLILKFSRKLNLVMNDAPLVR